MQQEKLRVICREENFKDTFQSYIFLMEQQKNMLAFQGVDIVWDMSRMKRFDVTLLSMLHFIFREQEELGKTILLELPGKKSKNFRNTILSIFEYYAEDKRAFFKPQLINGERIRETEDILLKFLKKLNLQDYDKIKTLLSELFVNIKMHTKNKIGYFTGRYSKHDGMLTVSIANGDYSIAKQLNSKREMVFEDDLSALEWTLRKSNSTRDDKESGGLGLYLLRRYIHELDGTAIILSGKCYLELDNRCFDPKNENLIIQKDNKEVYSEYKGTIITLSIPYIIRKDDEKRSENIEMISILDMLGEGDGVFGKFFR